MRLLASSCLSVRPQELSFPWMDFHENLYLSIFRKSVEKFGFYTFLITSRSFLLEREMFHTKILHKIKTPILHSMAFFFFENRTFMREFAKSCTAGHTRDDNIEHAHCMLDT